MIANKGANFNKIGIIVHADDISRLCPLNTSYLVNACFEFGYLDFE